MIAKTKNKETKMLQIGVGVKLNQQISLVQQHLVPNPVF